MSACCVDAELSDGHTHAACSTVRAGIAALRAERDKLAAENEQLRRELKETQKSRVISAIFGHHKGAPKPFGLYRREDVSGVSGTGIVALGCEFEDGLAVLRWNSAWPTSVVFHERGIESIKAIHGHDGRTEIVWLSDELESLANMEQQLDRAQSVVDAARALLAALERTQFVWARQGGKTAITEAYQAARAAVDSYDTPGEQT